ncbi:histidine kinase [Hymenobacter sp. BT664]|uniref:Histidine kinase n=1 Tax=Hymenobacter montanus TaxID=2771359 RepID=A0A927BH06_9BACT|nr:histidine kinase [Hymenobacter montanus]MBD2769889.1 histidine kinase [Hymenobacter montanus]
MRQYLHAKRWYWIFQLLGWGGFWATQVQANFMLDRYDPDTLVWLTVAAMLGLLLTHCYRALLLRRQVLRMPLPWQAGVAVLGLLGLSVSMHLLSPLLYMALLGKWKWPYSGGWATFTFGVIGMGRYLIVWVLAYHFFVVGERLAQVQVRELHAAAARRQAELDLLRSQINPHFLFNALNSVRALTLSDPHRARTAVTQLADLLRYTLNYEQHQLISLREELTAVHDYLALEQTRFGPERLRLDVAVPSELLSWPVPPATLLTLVENAVKHGISATPNGGVLRLVAQPMPTETGAAAYLSLEVSQPGHLPLTPLARPAGQRGGLGLLNTRQRLRSLYGDAASLTLQENPIGTVIARLDVPANPLP